VNYGVNRLVLKTPLRFRNKSSFDQYGAFEKAIENQIAFDKLFEWFFDQEFYENIRQKEEPNYQDKSLKAVKTAMLAMFDDCEDIHIVAKPYSMRITKKGNNLDVLQLSDGEKCTLALFGDIARRLAVANPSLTNPLEGEGVVLIDELDLHMHPSWQRKVMGALKSTFPNIQFIVTTHSPQILGEIDQEFNVISLLLENGNLEIHSLRSLYGMDSNAILEDVLKTDSISRIIKNKVDEMYRLIEQKKYDDAEVLANMIEELTLGRNADTVRARVLLKRGRMRNA
jgi:predicted ATP-binding protein involved in virulence